MTELAVPGPELGKLRLEKGIQSFWFLVINANLGRTYDPGEFMDAVRVIVRRLKGRVHWALLLQELDEDDPAPEHKQLLAALRKMLDVDDVPRAGWHTHEPIVLSPSMRLRRERVVETMGSGLDIGAPKGTGPTRYCVSCVAKEEGLRVGLATDHPHRNLQIPVVQEARREGNQIMRDELRELYEAGDGISVVWGRDPNDASPPVMIRGERTAIKRGGTGDHIRFKEHPQGARLRLKDAGSLKGTIDPHDPLWALFEVAARAA